MKNLLLMLALTATALAQSTPPVCPGASAPAANPTTAQIQSTAEAAAADPSFLLANESLENFDTLRFRIQDYANCTIPTVCYWADLDAQTTRAEAALKDALKADRRTREKLAIVLDIDETSLSSYCELQVEDYGYLPAMRNAWTVTPAASIPIPGTLRLYHAARAAHLAVFFVTGRPESQRAATASNLKLAGYEGWEGLSLKQQPGDTTTYKSSERQKIVAGGYRIVMNVGDQWSDLNGPARAEINVKLPNPFYYLP